MDLLITGATGFLGSHLTLAWLLAEPASRVGCLVRASDAASGLDRIHTALSRAARDQGVSATHLLTRVDAFPGELDDPAWIDQAQAWMRGPTEVIHCAANLSFRETDRAAVWHSNVDGTAVTLEAVARLSGIAAFNYVSTAYVAGDREGAIMEDEHARPPRFNNPYEHSKWTAEGLVRAACAAAAVPWRVLRPSIVIGHSETHRFSSQSGFYQVVETLMRFGRQPRMASETIMLPVASGTSLDLIPIDRVVEEITALIAAGPATANQTFHVVAADPLRLADVLRELTPMSGVSIEVDRLGTSPSPLVKLVMNGLRYYMPYFAFARRFDRSGAQAALGSVPYRIGVDQLRGFVQSYLAEHAREHALKEVA